MTGGGAFIPTGPEDFELDELGQPSTNHAVQWVGKPGVKGPKWARLPLLTVGMLGIQVGIRFNEERVVGVMLIAW